MERISFATRSLPKMLRHGGSLKVIGELLGHRSIQVTTIYAKVDIPALRTLALAGLEVRNEHTSRGRARVREPAPQLTYVRDRFSVDRRSRRFSAFGFS